MLYNDRIINLTGIKDGLEKSHEIAVLMKEYTAANIIQDTLDDICMKIDIARFECMTATLECVEKLDDILSEVWDIVDRNDFEELDPIGVRRIYDITLNRANICVNAAIAEGADEGFIENRLDQFTYELAEAIPYNRRRYTYPTER